MKTLPSSWRVNLGVLIGLMALLTWLFVQAGAVSSDAHYRYLETLRAVQRADVETSAAVLATHAELVLNYDTLVRQIQRVRSGLAAAGQSPAYLGATDAAAVRDKAHELAVVFEQKADFIDRYQRGNAVLRNSVDYFPLAMDEFLVRADAQRRLAYYEGFARQTLAASRSPSREALNAVLRSSEKLKVLALPAAERAALDNLLLHASAIVDRHPEIDNLVREIVKIPTDRHLEELMRAYTDGHESSLRTTARYRWLLYAVAVLLLAYVVYSYVQIDSHQRDLALANIELVDRLAAQRRAEDRERLYATVFTNASEGMLIADKHRHIVAVNPAFSAITGYSAEEVTGQTPAMLSSGRQDADFYRQMWAELIEAGAWSGEIWNRRKDGSIYPEWLSIAAVPNGSIPDFYIGIFTDITDRKEVEERIHHLAHHDALTGLPNRLLLEDRIAQALMKSRRSGKPTAVMFLDLDRFKNINDTLGHGVGDSLLVEAATRGARTLRETDTLSRQGGDEFVIVLPEIESAQDAAQVGRKLLQALGEPYQLAGHELTVTASIGIALSPDDGTTVSDLLRNADTAMYRAKEEGRNLFRFYSSDMNFASLGELLLESHLRKALEHGELLLHYQPKMDALTGALIGAEALMRWNHPEHGMIPPGRFIPLAEECGLIGALGEWALHDVCRQQRRWLDAGLTAVPVAVNVSAQQFTQQDVPALVSAALAENRLPPDLLDLELTESLLVRNPSQTAAVLERLRDMQITMAIDDFGTGYSSLSYLKQFPVHALKIDRAFVNDIDEAGEQVKIAPAIIALAHSLNMYVIAEGVESETQRDFLIRHDCDHFQGFLFARPMPADEFALRLARPTIS